MNDKVICFCFVYHNMQSLLLILVNHTGLYHAVKISLTAWH